MGFADPRLAGSLTLETLELLCRAFGKSRPVAASERSFCGLIDGLRKTHAKTRRRSPAREYSTGTTNKVTKVDIAKPQPTAREMMLTMGS